MSLATVHPPEPASATPRSVPILESEANAVAVARQLAVEFAGLGGALLVGALNASLIAGIRISPLLATLDASC